MTVFLALLHGVNVGGKNKLSMSELRLALEASGFVRVETYIQSGNVLFESDEKPEVLQKKLEGVLAGSFGITSPVVLRTADELETLLRNCPFSADEIANAEALNSEGESFYVELLTSAPAGDKIERIRTLSSENEEFRIIDRDVYLLLRQSIRHSKLAGSLQKLDVPGTVRNWKTINKLQRLAKSRADHV